MLFNTYGFILFFTSALLIYYILPSKDRWIWLLIASYIFYMGWNPKYVILLFSCTVITYSGGLLIAKTPISKRKKCLLFVCVLICIFTLIYYKYLNFLFDSLHFLFDVVGRPTPHFDIILPVGISFYTFQSIGYLIDVYKDEIPAENNFFKYALFVSFFPQLVAGPIERSKNLLHQIHEPHPFDIMNLKHGFSLMLFGYFQKMVIADRIAIYVDHIFENYQGYAFFEIAIAIIGFSIQIYCDFCGYSNIAIGAAEMMGFRLMKNFNQPYFATSIKDFWRRWHISLSTWFRDYIYIPLGGSKHGIIRTSANLIITFLVSGAWHGAAWNYIIWGVLHGFIQLFERFFKHLSSKTRVPRNTSHILFSNRFFHTTLTFLLVNFAWLFFRCGGNISTLDVLHQMSSCFNIWVLFDKSLYLHGLDQHNWNILIISVFILFIVDFMHERKIQIRKAIDNQNVFFQVLLYTTVILFILLCGEYGPIIDPNKFIYFTF